MADIWKTLYDAARAVQSERAVSPFIEAGGVAAALLTRRGNLYTGVCFDTACGLGMCAERSAVAAMLTQGESEIVKILAVMPDGRVGPPCGACRELLMQLDAHSGEIEVLLDYETRQTARLRELAPAWWGAERFERRARGAKK
jgi:cytidine deaminase